MAFDHEGYEQKVERFLKPIRDAGYDTLHVNESRGLPSLDGQLRDYYCRALELDPYDYLLDLLEDGKVQAHPFRLVLYSGNDLHSPVFVFHCLNQYPSLTVQRLALTIQEKTITVDTSFNCRLPSVELMVELHQTKFPRTKPYKANREFLPEQQKNRKSL